jgi:outer membrane protein
MSSRGKAGLRLRKWCFALAAAAMPVAGSAAVDLMTAYQKAIEQSPGYQAAQAAYRAEAEAHPQALAKLLPQFGAQAGFLWAREHFQGQTFIPPQLPNDPNLELLAERLSHVDQADTYTEPKYLVALKQSVFHLQDIIGLKAADMQVAQAKVELDTARSTLTLDVAQAYFGVLAAKDNLRFALAKRDAYSQQLDQGTVRHKAGLMNDADFEEIKAEYATAIADVAQAQSDVEVSLSALAVLTVEPFTDLKLLPDTVALPAVEPNTIEPWVTQAVDQNLTVLSDQMATKVAEFDYQKAKAERYPNVDVVGHYAYERPTGGYPGEHLDINRQIGLQIQQPIYTGGAIDSSIRAAKANWDKAKAVEDQARGTATQQTRTAFFNTAAGPSRLDALKQAVDAAAAAQYATRVGYEVGTKTTADLLKAINQRYQAESKYAAARYQYLIYTLELKSAVGILSAADLQAINQWLQ